MDIFSFVVLSKTYLSFYLYIMIIYIYIYIVKFLVTAMYIHSNMLIVV